MPSPVYVITRNGRRAGPEMFKSKSKAEERFYKLLSSINQFDPESKNELKIVKTSSPFLIR